MTDKKYIIIDPRSGYDAHGKLFNFWDTMKAWSHWNMHRMRSISEACEMRAIFFFNFKPISDDVFNLAYVQGMAEKNQLDDASSASRKVASYIDISNSLNEPLIRRVMNLALSEVEHAAYLLTRHEVHANASYDNFLPHKGEMVMEMRITEDFSDVTLVDMRNTIHDYIVSRVLLEWAKLTYPKFADYWKEKTEADLKSITESSDRNTFGRLEHITPFW